jgi:hypothetical protein
VAPSPRRRFFAATTAPPSPSPRLPLALPLGQYGAGEFQPGHYLATIEQRARGGQLPRIGQRLGHARQEVALQCLGIGAQNGAAIDQQGRRLFTLAGEGEIKAAPERRLLRHRLDIEEGGLLQPARGERGGAE